MEGASALEDARLASALASGGTSQDVIYNAALSVVRTGRPGDILDFGAGIGQFTSLLTSRFPGARIAGADLMDRPPGLPETVEWRRSDLNDAVDLPGSRFDLIFSLEVIEHLENPRQFFRELYRLLKPGGELIVTTPNIACIRSLVSFALKGCFAFFDDTNYPAHITPQSPLDLQRAATEAGFVDGRVFFTDVGRLPKFVDTQWQRLPLVGRALKGRLFSDCVGVSFLKPGDLAQTLADAQPR